MAIEDTQLLVSLDDHEKLLKHEWRVGFLTGAILVASIVVAVGYFLL